MIPRSIILSLCVWLITPMAIGQEAQPAAEEVVTTYIGAVDGTNVHVRSGNSMQYYKCTKLSRPARVTVVGESDGWVKILPPAGTFSVISREYVRPDETGKAGVVTGDNVWVRAGGEMLDNDRLKDFWAIQLSLNKGDVVRILGQVGDYYKIVPPKGATFWMSADYVKRIEGAEVVEASTALDVTTQPSEVEADQDETAVAAATTQAVETSAAEPATVRQQFEAAEKLLAAEYDKPRDQRDLANLLSQYQAIPVANDDPLKPYVDVRIGFLQNAIKRERDIRSVEELARQTAQKQEQFEAQRAKITVEQPSPAPEAAYAARGVLSPSAIFSGGPRSPKRYILRNPRTNSVTAYVQAAGADADLAEFVGKYVGITGTKTYDKGLGIDIVDATEAVELTEGAQPPPAPKPIIGPMPEPIPGPTTAPATPATEPRAKPEVEPEPVAVEVEPVEAPKAEPEPVVVEVEPAEAPKAEPEPVAVEVEPAEAPKAEPQAPVEAETEAQAIVVEPVEKIEPAEPVEPVVVAPATQPAPQDAQAESVVETEVIVVEPEEAAPTGEQADEPEPTALPKPIPQPERPEPPVADEEPPDSGDQADAQGRPAVAPVPKAEAEPDQPAVPAEPEPATQPAAGPTLPPKQGPAPQPEPEPTPQPEPEPAPQPEPEPAPEPEDEPEPAPQPEPPVEPAKPLPPTGLPMIEPTTRPAEGPVNEEEYD